MAKENMPNMLKKEVINPFQKWIGINACIDRWAWLYMDFPDPVSEDSCNAQSSISNQKWVIAIRVNYDQ